MQYEGNIKSAVTYLNKKFFEPFDKIISDPKINYWLAGGSVLFAIEQFQNQPTESTGVRDFDLFLNNHKDVTSLTKKLTEKYDIVYKTKNSTAFKIPDIGIVDLVTTHWATPEKCINAFDFTVCQAAVDRQGKFYCSEQFFPDVSNNMLRLTHQGKVFTTLVVQRIKKYLTKGFDLESKTALKIIKDCNIVGTDPPAAYPF